MYELKAASGVKPIRTLDHFRMLAISPSGSMVCGAKYSSSGYSFTLTPKGLKGDKRQFEIDSRSSVQMIDVESGSTVVEFEGVMPLTSSFWANSANALIWSKDNSRGTVWVILDGTTRTSRRLTGVTFTVDSKATLEGCLLDWNKPRSEAGQFVVYSPTGKTLAAASAEPAGMQSRYNPAISPKVSPRGKEFLHSIDEVLILRSSEDLSVKWIQQYDPDTWNLDRVTFCPSGKLIALLQKARRELNVQPKNRVLLLDPADGKLLTIIPVDFSEFAVVSADQKFLAVATTRRTKALWEEYDLCIQIHSTADGKVISELLHDRVPRHESVMDTSWDRTIALAYTADNRYLISTGRKTNIWKQN